MCLDVPYPPDYGGVYDLFYKIKALSDQGVLIHLHCFEYGRGKQPELNQYCKSVTYYQRIQGLKGIKRRLPYIVSSRANIDLLGNLTKDKLPILLEGIHCTYFVAVEKLVDRKVIVRLHNVEYKYYSELARTTNNIFKKIYYLAESSLLKKYEKRIANKALLFSVSEKDKDIYIEKFKAKNIHYLPVFLPYNEVNSKEGHGKFCLYHGNLSVPENEKAVLWLLNNVFNKIELPFVIAGKNPSKNFEKLILKNKNVCLVANPSDTEMQDLITKAHIHILPSFNKTGVKIKLLNALFNGKFVITNSAAADGSGLQRLCEIANTPGDLIERISELFHKPFTQVKIEERKILLNDLFDNHKNAQKLTAWIW